MSAERGEFGDRVSQYIQHRHDERAVEEWLDARDREETEEHGAGAIGAEHVLAPIFRFLADGLSYGNLPHRAVAMLYVVRPDLVDGISFEQLAEEIGSSSGAIGQAVEQFRNEFPTMTGRYRPGFEKSERKRVLRGQHVKRLVHLREVRARSSEFELRIARERSERLAMEAREERLKGASLRRFFRALDAEIALAQKERETARAASPEPEMSKEEVAFERVRAEILAKRQR